MADLILSAGVTMSERKHNSQIFEAVLRFPHEVHSCWQTAQCCSKNLRPMFPVCHCDTGPQFQVSH